MPLSSNVLKIDGAILVPLIAIVSLVIFGFLISSLKSPQVSTIATPTTTPSPTITTAVTPTSLPDAKSLVTSPLLYPELKWQNINSPNPESTYSHSSFQSWQAELKGGENLYRYFDYKIFDFYKKQLEPIGWSSEYTADGPGGAVRKLTGFKDHQSQEIILHFDAPQCSSAGCHCPCQFKYIIFISSIDKI